MFPGLYCDVRTHRRFRRVKDKDLLLPMGERSRTEGKPLAQAHTMETVSRSLSQGLLYLTVPYSSLGDILGRLGLGTIRRKGPIRPLQSLVHSPSLGRRCLGAIHSRSVPRHGHQLRTCLVLAWDALRPTLSQ